MPKPLQYNFEKWTIYGGKAEGDSEGQSVRKYHAARRASALLAIADGLSEPNAKISVLQTQKVLRVAADRIAELERENARIKGPLLRKDAEHKLCDAAAIIGVIIMFAIVAFGVLLSVTDNEFWAGAIMATLTLKFEPWIVRPLARLFSANDNVRDHR
jgi:hypothetical protein